MTPHTTNGRATEEIYELLLHAAARRQPVAASYDGLPRLLCPHVLGRKSGRLQALFYQFEGESKTTPQKVIESEGVWRCLAVSKLRQVEACAGGWHTGPRFGKQTCIDEVDYDVDAYPEPSPQNGQ